MDHEDALTVLQLLTKLFEALKAYLELRRQSRDENGCESVRRRPRHLKK